VSELDKIKKVRNKYRDKPLLMTKDFVELESFAESLISKLDEKDTRIKELEAKCEKLENQIKEIRGEK